MQVNLLTQYRDRFLVGTRNILLCMMDDGRVSVTEIASFTGVAIAFIENSSVKLVEVEPPSGAHQFFGISKEQVRLSSIGGDNMAVIRFSVDSNILHKKGYDEKRIMKVMKLSATKAQTSCRRIASKGSIFFGQIRGSHEPTLMDYQTFHTETDDGNNDIFTAVVPRCGCALITAPRHLQAALALINNGPDSTGFVYAIGDFSAKLQSFGLFDIYTIDPHTGKLINSRNLSSDQKSELDLA